jgi:hypothetical protein
MKKLLMLLCVFTMAIGTISAQVTDPVKLRVVRKYDLDRKLLYERDTYAEMKIDVTNKQLIFTEGYKTIKFDILSAENTETTGGMKNTAVSLKNTETGETLFLQIFEDETYGIRFVREDGTYQYFQ